MTLNEYDFNRLLIIDDNEAIHDDFRKIFVIDDDDDTKALDALDAEMFGLEPKSKSAAINYELSFACQGREGLEIVKASLDAGIRFGVAFVDMRMPPGWDGVETIEQLWKVDPDLQVVICTAFSDHSWQDITARLGLTDQLLILKKPFDEVEVIQFAASLIKKRELLAESQSRLEHLQRVVVNQDEKLKVAHQDAEHLISSLSSALISMDEDGRVSRWNPLAEHIFALMPSETIGKPFVDLPINWVNPEELQHALKSCAVVQQLQREFRFVDTKGATRTLSATVCPILNDSTSQARLIMATDVTVQKALQIQLDQAQRLESVGQLAAGVAHEINTPMQYIGDNVRYVAKTFDKLSPVLDCLTDLLEPEISDAELQEIRRKLPDSFKPKKIRSTIQQIPDALMDSIEGVEAVSKIVAAMKEFSHPGTEQKCQSCVNHVLESTITVSKNEWKYVAEIETALEPDLPKIDALPSELNQAFLNIIVNASHAIGDRVTRGEIAKGLIRVATESNADFVNVRISDNGGGIPESARKRVFEPFFTTKEVGKGTGQGLAIAFAVIVKKHGGKLSFEVQEGVGTTFNIELPREAAGTEITKVAHAIA